MDAVDFPCEGPAVGERRTLVSDQPWVSLAVLMTPNKTVEKCKAHGDV